MALTDKEKAINHEDGVAIKNNLNLIAEAVSTLSDGHGVNLADLEVSPAEAAHSIGDLLVYNGFLYEVTAAIAIGDTLTEGTNISKISMEDLFDGVNTQLTEDRNDIDWLTDVVANAHTDDWGVIQSMIQKGLGSQLYPVGTQFLVHHATYGDMVFDVIGHDHDIPTGKTHSMTLLMHHVIYSTQFDEREAFYYAENGLTAGTYNVTINRQPWYAADVGKTFQFTLASDVPAGAILTWNGSYNETRDGKTVSVYATHGATSASQTAIISEGSGGTALGNVDGTGACNIYDRTVFGSNDWEESGLRQWLNADVASNWWTAKTNWDRLVSYYSRPGFLYGFDSDFKAVLAETTHLNRSNEVYDSHGTKQAYSTTEKIFLLSNEEVGLSSESGITCGTVYPYYANAQNADRIKYDISSQSTARYWWLRLPGPSGAGGERFVFTSGALDGYSAGNGFGAVAACVIA